MTIKKLPYPIIDESNTKRPIAPANRSLLGRARNIPLELPSQPRRSATPLSEERYTPPQLHAQPRRNAVPFSDERHTPPQLPAQSWRNVAPDHAQSPQIFPPANGFVSNGQTRRPGNRLPDYQQPAQQNYIPRSYGAGNQAASPAGNRQFRPQQPVQSQYARNNYGGLGTGSGKYRLLTTRQKRLRKRRYTLACCILIPAFLLVSLWLGGILTKPAAHTASMAAAGAAKNTSVMQGNLQVQTHENPHFKEWNDAATKLQQWRTTLDQMKLYGLDTTSYEPRFNADQNALSAAQTVAAANVVNTQLDADSATTVFPYTQGKAQYMVKQFHQAVTDWGNSHQFNDTYDGKKYPIDYEYATVQNNYGEGSKLDDIVSAASTLNDYQGIVTRVNNDQAMFKAMQDDAQDQTSWQQPHATDAHMMQYYNAKGLVIVVSFYEQALRVYQDGKLIKAFQTSTGQFMLPTPPGFWQLNSHVALSTFTSIYGPDSPFYFPPTPVKWAMGFNEPSLGYFIHSSPWRTNYGLGTEFPHSDPLNDNSESRNGSHGCVNLPVDEAAWLYQQAPNGTTLITY